MAVVNLTDTQDVDVQVVGKTRKGSPAPLQNITFAGSDDAVATVTQDATDPSKAVISAVTAGIMQVTAKADADLSDGVVDVIGLLDVVVGAGQATVVEMVAGTPREQPAGSPGTSTGATIRR
jgi:hypothetical protein